MAWLSLFLAGICEITWAVSLKYTEGFSKLYPSIITLLAMVLSIVLLAHAVKYLPMGTAYAVWTGIGVVGTVVYGILVAGEPASLCRLFCIALIVCAISGLKWSS